jgi:hypothetical protein
MPVSVHQKRNNRHFLPELYEDTQHVAFLMDTNWHIATLMDSSHSSPRIESEARRRLHVHNVHLVYVVLQ